MKNALQIGKIYLLKGGYILRYRGPYSGKGPMLAFGSVLDPNEDPVGYSAAPSEVVKRITRRDLDWLKKRQKETHARGLSDAEVACVIAEIKIPYPRTMVRRAAKHARR